MSDFSKLTVDGTTYNVKDATARNNYESVNTSITEINDKLNNFSISYAPVRKLLQSKLGIIKGGSNYAICINF